MRLRIVISTLLIGGAERHVSKIMPRLAAMGYDVTIISLSTDNPLADKCIGCNVKTSMIKTPRSNIFAPLRLAINFCRLLWDFWCNPCDITHFFLPEAYFLGMLASFLAPKTKRIMSRRSLNNYQTRKPILKYLEPLLHKHCDVILANSMAVKKDLEKEGVKNVSLIYNGTDFPTITKSREQIRKEFNTEDDTLVFIIIANLIPYKNHQLILKALKQLKTPYELWCIGQDRGILPGLQEISQGMPVKWLGLRTDYLLHAADIAVLVSQEEGFSNFIIEAMFAGLPLIVTDVGGNAEAVIDKETGIVIPSNDLDTLKRAVSELANNADLRKQYGEAGAKRAFERFSLDHCLSQYNELYQTVMASV